MAKLQDTGSPEETRQSICESDSTADSLLMSRGLDQPIDQATGEDADNRRFY